MGLDINLGRDDGSGAVTYIEFASAAHQFPVGYIRSGYVDGVDLFLTEFLGRGLRSIFPEHGQRAEETGRFYPDWTAARNRCSLLRQELSTAEIRALYDDRLGDVGDIYYANHLDQLGAILETIDFVRGMENPGNYFLEWSD